MSSHPTPMDPGVYYIRSPNLNALFTVVGLPVDERLPVMSETKSENPTSLSQKWIIRDRSHELLCAREYTIAAFKPVFPAHSKGDYISVKNGEAFVQLDSEEAEATIFTFDTKNTDKDEKVFPRSIQVLGGQGFLALSALGKQVTVSNDETILDLVQIKELESTCSAPET